MKEFIQFLDDKTTIVKVEDVKEYMKVTIDDYFEGNIEKSILVWEDNDFWLVKEDETRSISIQKWEKIINMGMADKTFSDFVSYLNKYFLIKDKNPITADAKRGLISMLSTIENYF